LKILIQKHFNELITLQNEIECKTFVNCLYEYTGGIPRFVEYYYNAISGLRELQNIDEDEEFKLSFKVTNVETFMKRIKTFIEENCKERKLDYIFEGIDIKFKKLIYKLYLYSKFNILIEKGENIDGFIFDDIISRTPFYITTKDDKIKIVKSSIIYTLISNYLSENYFLKIINKIENNYFMDSSR
jgi:hypothetical protein